MKCNEVMEKLPEYIAGVYTKEEMSDIAEHINGCPSCSQHLRDLYEPVQKPEGKSELEKEKIRRLMKNIRWKLIARISASVIGVLIVFFYALPLIYYSISGVTNPVLRASMDMVQFSQPNAAGGYSTGGDRIFGWEMRFFTSETIGKDIAVGTEYRNIYYFGGSVECPSINSKNGLTALGIGNTFIHPEFKYTVKRPVEEKWSDIDKLGETDVTIDVSLNNTASLEQIIEVLKKYQDVRVLWMAVETGEEKQIQYGDMNYYMQWGIPGRFTDITASHGNPGTEFLPGTFAKYKEKLSQEMEWLNHNKYRVKPDADLLKYYHIDNSVGTKAEYILKNGCKVYGLRVTGKSADAAKFGMELNAREVSLEGIRFRKW